MYKMKHFRKTFITLSALAFLFFHSNAQIQDKAANLLQEYIKIQHKMVGFSGVVVVSKNNKIIYKEAIGTASQELNVPINLEHKFRIASITKQFTAMLVMLAINENKLHLQDSLAVYFPDIITKEWRSITLQQLLTHTSGVPHNDGIDEYWKLKALLPLTKEEALAEIFKMKLSFKPGSSVKYSSPGYFLLACVLEKVYSKPYEQLLQEKILVPLNIQSTGISNNYKIVPSMTTGYHMHKDSLISAPYRSFSLMKGSGDMYATATDLSKWNESFLSDSNWHGDLKKLLFSFPVAQKINNEAYYGYGWFLRPKEAGRRKAYYHGGGTFGYSAISVIYPDDHISIVIMSNVSALPVNKLWHVIEKIIFDETITLPVTNNAVAVSIEHMQLLVGKYIAADNRELTIIQSGKELFAKLGANPSFQIYPTGPYQFKAHKVNVSFTFKLDTNNNIVGLEANNGGSLLHFNKQAK